MFGCLAIVLAIAATPLFRAADTPPSPQKNRVTVIDGLRGFLALGVVFHHVAVYHVFLVTGKWGSPPSNFYAMLGPVGVSLFFMVTGYLFWGRLVRTQGKPGWIALYINRLFRIGPLYLVAIVTMLFAVAVLGDFTLRVGKLQLTAEVARWLLTFGMVEGGVVNDYNKTPLLLASVTWTIRFEWLFYFSLPVLSLVTRDKRWHLPFASLALAACLIWISGHSNGRAAVLFVIGMLCASLQQKKMLLRLPDLAGSALVIGLFALVFQHDDVKTVPTILLLGLIFFLIVSGTTVFGLLTSKPARRLGDISYGIYLLQGLVLAAVYWPGKMTVLALESAPHHWALALLATLILISLATLAHVAIERPGIALGHRINKAFIALF